MSKFISYDGYYMPKNKLTDKELKDVKKDLTITPNILMEPKTKEEKDKLTYEIYKSTDKHIIMPIYYGITKFGKCDNKMNIQKTKFKFTGKLRDYQESIVEKCLSSIKEKGGGLLSVPCGAGKTTMALYMASELKLKTLIIVHRSILLTQWIERINQFTDAKVGIIRGKKVDVDGKDIVIGMIHSVSQRDYDPEIFKQFSFIIYDEAHHCPSKVFSQALMKTTGIHTLALTATPYRNDNLIKVMHWFLGDTMYRIKLKVNSAVVVKRFFYYSSDKSLFVEKKAYFKGKMLPSVTKMVGNISQIKTRTRNIANIITEILKNTDENRKIFVLSKLKSILNDTKDIVDRKVEESEQKTETRLYTGDMKDDERDEAAEKADVMFATYDIANDGFDVERLNTLILATSRKDVIQSTGRIMRKPLEVGNTRPLIIDFIDDLSVFSNHARERLKYYDRCKYKIENYYFYDNKLVSEEDYEELKNGKNKEIKKKSLEKALKTKKITDDEITKRNDIIFDTSNEDSEEEIVKPYKINPQIRYIPMS
uniref:Helicase ATP-binding domain-containing protein n=1 Tax=viral metagenome TaxID=1070528 RepID=A0A6C0EE13_9ZZZZ